MQPSTLTAAVVGIVLGLRHAFEPDHVAAITTLAGQRTPLRHALGLGSMWALGHAATIGLAGLGAAALGLRISGRLQSVVELIVAAVIVWMGARVILSWRLGRWHLHGHRHDGAEHLHLHSHARGTAHDHAHPRAGVRWALGIGVLHGFAGSGAALALWMASGASATAGGTWFVAFALGTAAGMMLVTATLWGAMRIASARGGAWLVTLRLASAAAAIAVGIGLAGHVLAGG